jgi:CheY-like chemotaxis protein
VSEDCGATVLVVDDDGVCHELISTLLGRAGFSSVGAANGEEAAHPVVPTGRGLNWRVDVAKDQTA